jgi:hypothetical protein
MRLAAARMPAIAGTLTTVIASAGTPTSAETPETVWEPTSWVSAMLKIGDNG